MTIGSEKSKTVPLEGNGVNKTFPWDFLIPEEDDYRIVFTDTDGTEADITTNFTISGIDDPDGGEVTYPVTGSAITAGQFITIVRELDFTQETSLRNQSKYYPEVLESALDRLCMLSQQNKEVLDRAVTVPISSSDTPQDYLATMEAYLSSTQTASAAATASATAAAASESAASTSETNASNSAAASASSATAAAASESAASTSETNAEIAETNAAASETAAAASAVTAADEADDAASSASAAATSEANALSSANDAATAQTAAEAARDATLTAFDNFDDRYLGAKSADPATDNDGDPLVAGQLYFFDGNGTPADATMKVYTGSVWVAAYVSGTDFLARANNLSDVQSASAARANLGLGSLAVKSNINNGDWSGDDLAITNGGTGASTVAAARANLGLEIDSDVQSYDADTAKTDVAQSWSRQQYHSAQTLTDAASIAWNLSTQPVAEVTLGGNRTLANPSNKQSGAFYTLKVIQDGTGSRTLSFGTDYKGIDGAVEIASDAGAYSIITFYCDLAGNMNAVSVGGFSTIT